MVALVETWPLGEAGVQYDSYFFGDATLFFKLITLAYLLYGLKSTQSKYINTTETNESWYESGLATFHIK